MEKSANGILRTTIEKVRDLVDVSTIIGEPINLPDGLTIIPVSKVTYGFASGGSDFPSKNNVELFGGAGGAGITINPVAFLVVKDGDVTIKHIVSNDNAVERAVSLVPEMFDKVTNLSKKKKADAEAVAEAVAE
jgi:sporulation protein YtfJ